MQHWDRIEAFVEVVRHESFAGAARGLGVSSSHVSRLVARLETELGTQLLYRTTRRLRLTDAGAVYFEHCAQLFDGFQEALTAISDYQRRPTGVLKLTCATTFGEKFIARWSTTSSPSTRNCPCAWTSPTGRWTSSTRASTWRCAPAPCPIPH